MASTIVTVYQRLIARDGVGYDDPSFIVHVTVGSEGELPQRGIAPDALGHDDTSLVVHVVGTGVEGECLQRRIAANGLGYSDTGLVVHVAGDGEGLDGEFPQRIIEVDRSAYIQPHGG